MGLLACTMDRMCSRMRTNVSQTGKSIQAAGGPAQCSCSDAKTSSTTASTAGSPSFGGSSHAISKVVFFAFSTRSTGLIHTVWGRQGRVGGPCAALTGPET
jgi:hypothetical protein